MPDNKDAAARLLALAPNSSVSEIVREIDLSEIGEAFKHVPPLKVNVNPPAIFDVMLQEVTHDDQPARPRVVSALAIMTGIDVKELDRWADPLLYMVFYKARERYWEYWAEVRKNSTG